MDLEALNKIAVKMVEPGTGILAADESTGTIGKRMASINTENTEENRRDWQSAKDGTPFVKLIQDAGAIPGIKVDKGITPLAGRPGETITQGLDGLRERLAEYYELGARFAKWRAVIEISHPDQYVGMTPSRGGLKANNHALGRYAALCQEAGIVPIVEPEVLMGGHHSVERCHEVTEKTLNSLFTELYEQGVALEGTILKPNKSALFAWKGEDANYDAAQAAFNHRARMNGLASLGEWSAEIDDTVDA